MSKGDMKGNYRAYEQRFNRSISQGKCRKSCWGLKRDEGGGIGRGEGRQSGGGPGWVQNEWSRFFEGCLVAEIWAKLGFKEGWPFCKFFGEVGTKYLGFGRVGNAVSNYSLYRENNILVCYSIALCCF